MSASFSQTCPGRLGKRRKEPVGRHCAPGGDLAYKVPGEVVLRCSYHVPGLGMLPISSRLLAWMAWVTQTLCTTPPRFGVQPPPFTRAFFYQLSQQTLLICGLDPRHLLRTSPCVTLGHGSARSHVVIEATADPLQCSLGVCLTAVTGP